MQYSEIMATSTKLSQISTNQHNYSIMSATCTLKQRLTMHFILLCCYTKYLPRTNMATTPG